MANQNHEPLSDLSVARWSVVGYTECYQDRLRMTPLKRIWDNGDDDYVLSVYNGHGKPTAVVTCPREVDFIVKPFALGHPRPSASCLMICQYQQPQR